MNSINGTCTGHSNYHPCLRPSCIKDVKHMSPMWGLNALPKRTWQTPMAFLTVTGLQAGQGFLGLQEKKLYWNWGGAKRERKRDAIQWRREMRINKEEKRLDLREMQGNMKEANVCRAELTRRPPTHNMALNINHNKKQAKIPAIIERRGRNRANAQAEHGCKMCSTLWQPR